MRKQNKEFIAFVARVLPVGTFGGGTQRLSNDIFQLSTIESQHTEKYSIAVLRCLMQNGCTPTWEEVQ
jgi:hypothetical protein